MAALAWAIAACAAAPAGRGDSETGASGAGADAFRVGGAGAGDGPPAGAREVRLGSMASTEIRSEAASSGSAAIEIAASGQDLPPGAVAEDLEGGPAVIALPIPSMDEVAVRAAWEGGLRLETELPGGTHELLARTVTSGCGPWGTARAIDRRARDIGARVEGFTSRDGFGLRGEWGRERWHEGLDLLSACAESPRFERAAVLQARRRLHEAHRAREGDPGVEAFHLVASALFEDHPYGLDPLGNPASLDEVSRGLLADVYDRYYPIADMTLAVVGDIDAERVLDRVRERFEPREATASAPRPAVDLPEPPAEDRELYRYVDRDRAFVALAYRGAALADSDRYALEVLATAASARLAARARRELRATDRAGAISADRLDPGYIAFYTETAPEDRTRAANLVAEVARAAADGEIGQDEVDAAARSLVRDYERARADPAARAAALALRGAFGLSLSDYEAYAERVRAVTAEDVARVGARYLGEAAGVRATATPVELSPEAERRARGAGDESGEGGR